MDPHESNNRVGQSKDQTKALQDRDYFICDGHDPDQGHEESHKAPSNSAHSVVSTRSKDEHERSDRDRDDCRR